MEMLRELGNEVWFSLGDRDLGLCIERRRLLDAGFTLSEAHAKLTHALGVSAAVIPMSDDVVRTRIASGGRSFPLQEFLIVQAARAPIDDVRFDGAGGAAGAAGALDALARADAVIIGPSNPIISIGPILAIESIRVAIETSSAPVVAVSPIVAGAVVKGPTAACLAWAGRRADSDGVARYYGSLIDAIVADEPVAGVRTLTRDVAMGTAQARPELAQRYARARGRAARMSAAPPARTLAVLPVKRFELAKTRLGAALSVAQRRRLAQAMVADVLDALLAAPELAAVAVVTNERAVAELARDAGAEVLPDPREAGQSAAATAGIAHAIAGGYARVLLVPGDCPALDGATLRALLSAPAPPPAVTIVADRHGLGTNALLLAPPDAIEPGFGEGSFERHRERALASGAGWHVAALPALALDVDTPADLAALCATTAATRAAHERGAGLALMGALEAFPIGGLPEIEAGADLAAMIAAAAPAIRAGDIVVVAHKAVSKAQGRTRRLADIEPGPEAGRLAAELGKDPRHVQAILDETAELVRAERGVLIVRTRHGLVCANAGIDESSTPARGTIELLLPVDPDGAARGCACGSPS